MRGQKHGSAEKGRFYFYGRIVHKPLGAPLTSNKPWGHGSFSKTVPSGQNGREDLLVLWILSYWAAAGEVVTST